MGRPSVKNDRPAIRAGASPDACARRFSIHGASVDGENPPRWHRNWQKREEYRVPNSCEAQSRSMFSLGEKAKKFSDDGGDHFVESSGKHKNKLA